MSKQVAYDEIARRAVHAARSGEERRGAWVSLLGELHDASRVDSLREVIEGMIETAGQKRGSPPLSALISADPRLAKIGGLDVKALADIRDCLLSGVLQAAVALDPKRASGRKRA